MSGILFKILHWPGGGLLLKLGTFAIPLYIIYYFIVRMKGTGKLAFNWNDLILTIIAFSAYTYITRTLVNPGVVDGYVKLEELYEKSNAGYATANDLIYNRLDSISLEENQELRESMQQVRTLNNELHQYMDSLRQAFIASFYHDPLGNEFRISRYSPNALAQTGLGYEFFIKDGHGAAFKRELMHYLFELDKVRQSHQLISPYASHDPDLQDRLNTWGDLTTWEDRMFGGMPVAAILTNFSRLRQTALLGESIFLTGLIGQLNLSGEALALQELALEEAKEAMAFKENEMVRLRQQQELQEARLNQSAAELRNSKTMTGAAIAGIVFVLILFAISTRAYMLKQKDNKKLSWQNEEIINQKDEIEAQRDEIEAQRDLVFNQKEQIERTHNEISASIDYAMRLQGSILPDQKLLREQFSDHFVFFRPKQKVSGDFYWWTKNDQQIHIAVADCTGHGVPGAFMSLLGASLLKEAVVHSKITDPGEILGKLRKEVILALDQQGSSTEQKDGMDLSLIAIHTDTLVCTYAGANNPLYLIRNSKLTNFKPDLMPVSHYERMDPFTTKETQLEKGDQLYMFSDGYADQFGGKDRKKFKYAAFQNLLALNSEKPMAEQHLMLEDTMTDWQGSHEQIDDMVVLGIKI
jgi:serine phosphatase RsbU (regulator of sigma subunit)